MISKFNSFLQSNCTKMDFRQPRCQYSSVVIDENGKLHILWGTKNENNYKRKDFSMFWDWIDIVQHKWTPKCTRKDSVLKKYMGRESISRKNSQPRAKFGSNIDYVKHKSELKTQFLVKSGVLLCFWICFNHLITKT